MVTEEQFQQLLDMTSQLVSSQAATKQEIINMKNLVSLQNSRWERSNPFGSDYPIYDWTELTVPPGYQVTFSYLVPEGNIYYLTKLQANFVDDSAYQIFLDSEPQDELTETVCDFGDHWNFFTPPKKINANASVTITNNSLTNQIYVVFFGGFFRKIQEEVL